MNLNWMVHKIINLQSIANNLPDAFTVWEFLIPLRRFHEALSCCVQIPPPRRWPSGPIGHIHSLWHIHYGNILLCETHILSKCNRQIICDTLQIDNLLNHPVQIHSYVDLRTRCLFTSHSISQHSMWFLSPPNAGNMSSSKYNQHTRP